MLPIAAVTADHDSSRWEKYIARFQAADKKQMPQPGGILFIGSSSIRMWKTLEQDFPGLPVTNRGFGGSQIADSNHFAERIVHPYKPRQIVLYAGDNDVAAGKSPETVLADFQQFVKTVHGKLRAAEAAVDDRQTGEILLECFPHTDARAADEQDAARLGHLFFVSGLETGDILLPA